MPGVPIFPGVGCWRAGDSEIAMKQHEREREDRKSGAGLIAAGRMSAGRAAGLAACPAGQVEMLPNIRAVSRRMTSRWRMSTT